MSFFTVYIFILGHFLGDLSHLSTDITQRSLYVCSDISIINIAIIVNFIVCFSFFRLSCFGVILKCKICYRNATKMCKFSGELEEDLRVMVISI